MTACVNVVWFKRDLRVTDHAPLTQACASGAVLPIYLYEPSLLQQPDVSAQHVAFTNECLQSLVSDLNALGLRLVTRVGEAIQVLAELKQHFDNFVLWSHEETGNGATYVRDNHVAAWCRANAIVWNEIPNAGVVRRLKNRDVWSRIWTQRMQDPPLDVPQNVSSVPTSIASHGIVPVEKLPVNGIDKAMRQRGGRAAALVDLDSFFTQRGQHYRVQMSSPLVAADACSRISAHLAYGTLSIKETVHAVQQQRTRLLAMDAPERGAGWLPSLKSFEGRLHWHCHFIQKLESAPDIEFTNMHRMYRGLREDNDDAMLQRAWRAGETGLPMIDACMRMLAATGWINFRMRAMLVSFSSYHLWQHWREPALHLAREFLDYEPGIHYPQVQMQSGTTGINTVRIYNPIKQARDHDPDGIFVRRWIPELARVPTDFIFEPWLMTDNLQHEYGCVLGRDYPMPIVDVAQAADRARKAIWALRQGAEFRSEAQAIFQAHGSRSPSRERRSGGGGISNALNPRSGKARAVSEKNATPVQSSLFENE
jgi:deoxyribodipyrimidine photo-lyase